MERPPRPPSQSLRKTQVARVVRTAAIVVLTALALRVAQQRYGIFSLWSQSRGSRANRPLFGEFQFDPVERFNYEDHTKWAWLICAVVVIFCSALIS